VCAFRLFRQGAPSRPPVLLSTLVVEDASRGEVMAASHMLWEWARGRSFGMRASVLRLEAGAQARPGKGRDAVAGSSGTVSGLSGATPTRPPSLTQTPTRKSSEKRSHSPPKGADTYPLRSGNRPGTATSCVASVRAPQRVAVYGSDWSEGDKYPRPRGTQGPPALRCDEDLMKRLGTRAETIISTDRPTTGRRRSGRLDSTKEIEDRLASRVA
jgi:hypothetical protein